MRKTQQVAVPTCVMAMPHYNNRTRTCKYTSIQVDLDSLNAILTVQAELEQTLGFKPSLRQTLKHILEQI